VKSYCLSVPLHLTPFAEAQVLRDLVNIETKFTALTPPNSRAPERVHGLDPFIRNREKPRPDLFASAFERFAG
jgi:hypothetical protein